MANRLFAKVFGTRFDRALKRIQPIVDAILEQEKRLKDLGDAELQAQTAKFREMIAQRTGALQAEVERLKQAKHDCPDPEQRANLGDQLAKAEQSFVNTLQSTLDDILPEAFATLRRLLEARMGKAGKREYVQVLRLLETFRPEDVHAAAREALRLGAIGYDAVKHLVLCRIERRPPKLDLTAYPYLPRVTVATTSAGAASASSCRFRPIVASRTT